jgi:hypothetical protein
MELLLEVLLFLQILSLKEPQQNMVFFFFFAVTILEIEPFKEKPPSTNEERCSEQTQDSTGFELIARYKNNEKIQLAAEKKFLDHSDDEKTCLGTQQRKQEEWKCSSGLKKIKKPSLSSKDSSSKARFEDSSKYQYVEGTTKHFSNFAVLLLGAYEINGCRSTLWIAHVVVTAGVLGCCCLLLNVTRKRESLQNFRRNSIELLWI